MLDSLELWLQTVMTAMWVLEFNSGPRGREFIALSRGAIFPGPKNLFLIICIVCLCL